MKHKWQPMTIQGRGAFFCAVCRRWATGPQDWGTECPGERLTIEEKDALIRRLVAPTPEPQP